ncbi:PIG-L family deacetylase [Peijinzhouia sedimentorum]
MQLKKIVKILSISIGVIFIILLALFFWAHGQLHNRNIPELAEDRREEFSTVMTFFPHPDDEIAVSGTLHELRKSGSKLILVCITKGEAGPTGGLVEQSQLGKLRAQELTNVAELLQASKLELLDLPDGGLIDLPFDSLKTLAKNFIDYHQPDLVITYDSEVGLYGHDDHLLTGKAMEEVYLENKGNPGFPVKELWQVTLSPNQIKIALKLSEGFKNRYPQDGEEGLPLPSFYIYTQSNFHLVKQGMELHKSQREVFQDLMPYYDQVPAFIYSRLFDREYFYRVE